MEEKEVSRELHIRLRSAAARDEKNLYPLRDYLIDHPGASPVFIHVPFAGNALPEQAAAAGDSAGAASTAGAANTAGTASDAAGVASAAGAAETIIRTAVRFEAGGEAIAQLGKNPAVAEVWVA
jgi:hypothetical protein